MCSTSNAFCFNICLRVQNVIDNNFAHDSCKTAGTSVYIHSVAIMFVLTDWVLGIWVRVPLEYRGLRFVCVSLVQHLVQEVYVSCSQLQCLNFWQFIGRKGGYDFSEGRKCFVKTLRPLSFPNVGHHPLTLHFFGRLRRPSPRFGRRLAFFRSRRPFST